MKASVPALLFGLALCFSAPALAVYKCESDGKVTYGDVPCPDGKVLDITTPATSDASGRQLAQEKKALAQMEKERHKREAVEERERKSANRADAAKRKQCGALARRQARADALVRTSVGKANERAKLEARQVAEDYEAACGKWPERQLGLAR